MILRHRTAARWGATLALSASIGMFTAGVRAQEVVTSFAPAGTTDMGVWFEDDVRPRGHHEHG